MKRMQSTLSHTFSQVPKAEIQRSKFDRSHGYKTTFDAGYLVPIFVDEALPGDTFSLQLTAFARLATPIKPIMDNMFMDTQFFSVPLRLVMDNFQKLMGEQVNPGDSTDYVMPTITAPVGGYAAYSVYDYMGLPTGVAGIEHSAVFMRALNLIWNQWYRDQNLQTSLPVPTGDGPDDPALYTLQRRGKRHDYFTSALPWPQKGPSVMLPLGSDAPISRITGGADFISSIGGTDDLTNTSGTLQWIGGGVSDIALNAVNFVADLDQATAATINALRQATQIQKMYERDARGGTRYTEIIRSHFGVTSPDARLQRPEYLGGGSTPIQIQPIAQTSGSGTYTDTPQGNLGALGTTFMQGHGFNKSFTEHCIIIGFVSVRADMTYQQGINRMWSRSTRHDFYWPALSHIGEQAIFNKEIYAQGTPADDDVFGYQERYAEYRYKPSLVTGAFRSQHAQSLDIWHLAQDYTALPTLSSAFIEENPPVDRIIAVQDEPHFLYDSYIKLKCARPMPMYGVPGMMDHF